MVYNTQNYIQTFHERAITSPSLFVNSPCPLRLKVFLSTRDITRIPIGRIPQTRQHIMLLPAFASYASAPCHARARPNLSCTETGILMKTLALLIENPQKNQLDTKIPAVEEYRADGTLQRYCAAEIRLLPSLVVLRCNVFRRHRLYV